jgi:hypothetical protein
MNMTHLPPNATDETTVTGAFKIDPFRGSNNGEVSRQWASRPADQRFLDLTSLRAHLARRAENTNSRVVSSRALEFVAPDPETLADTHKLAVGMPGGDLIGPSHWSFGQLASLADFSAKELRKLPTPIVSDVLTYQMRRRAVEDVKVFDADGTMRAVTGPNYGWIKDADVADAVMQIAGNGTGDQRWKIPGQINWSNSTYDPFHPVTLDSTTLYASDRDLFIFLVDDTHPIQVGTLKDGSPDYMFRGFFISNSEVGAGACKLAAFYLRGICQNRMLWGVERFEELSIRHTSQAPARFIEEARPALLSLANGSEKSLKEGVAKAKEAVIAKDEADALEFLRNRGFSAKRAKAIAALDAEAGAEREKGDFPRTVWDMSQSITAYARAIPNNDDRIAIEQVAGKILNKVAA